MDKVLIVASSDKLVLSISELVLEAGQYTITTAASGSLARRLVLEEEWDTVVVNHPLKDDDAERFVQMVSEHSDATPILLVKSEFLPQVSRSLSETSTIFVEKPLIKQIFFQAMHLASSMKRRMANLKIQNARLEAQIEDLKYINRAKICLIVNQHISEEEAHHRLEKLAMDNRISKREAAKSILRLYSD